TALEAESASDAVRAILARSHLSIGVVRWATGKPAEALQAHRKALAIRQKLADANPTVTDFQYRLADSYDSIGWSLLMMGKPVESAEACRKASDIMQKLVDDNPANTWYQLDLASFQTNLGRALVRQKRWPEAFTALE